MIPLSPALLAVSNDSMLAVTPQGRKLMFRVHTPILPCGHCAISPNVCAYCESDTRCCRTRTDDLAGIWVECPA